MKSAIERLIVEQASYARYLKNRKIFTEEEALDIKEILEDQFDKIW
jgi:hypothetical protein